MADIDVQRKGPGIWPWILGLLLLALLIWALMELLGDDEPQVGAEDPIAPAVVTEPPATDTGAGAAAGLSEYMSTCVEAPADMGRQHEYTGGCIQQLANVIGSVVERDTVGSTAIQPRLEDFRQKAAAIQESDWQSTQHSNQVREVVTSAADLLQTVQEQRYRAAGELSAEVSQVREAAQSIRAQTPLMDQSEAVRTFFREAGQALRVMAETPAGMGA